MSHQSVGHKVLASGNVALVDPKGIAYEIVAADVWFHDGAEAAQMCECELDWNCGLHSDRMYTAIERINDAWALLDDPRGF